MIYWLSPVAPGATVSGGTRKLWDLDAILRDHGTESAVVTPGELATVIWEADDLVIVPEVFGAGLDALVPHPVKRASFVQNGYLIDHGIDPARPHPLVSTTDLVAVLTESDHTTDLVRTRCPELAVPLIRTHSSGNGRMGKDAGFFYGEWLRQKRILYFEYKNVGSWTGADILGPIFDDLELPEGWTPECLSGRSDAEIAQAMREAAIFVAPNRKEGMCAPTSEAMISGCVIVGWSGGGTEEYLNGRAVLVAQDDVAELRQAIRATAASIDWAPDHWARDTAEWSAWFQRTYSRDQEIAEICAIMERLTA